MSGRDATPTALHATVAMGVAGSSPSRGQGEAADRVVPRVRSLLFVALAAAVLAACGHRARTAESADERSAAASATSPTASVSAPKPMVATSATTSSAPQPRCPPAIPPTVIDVPMRFDALVAALGERIDALDPGPLAAELAPIAARHSLDLDSAALRRDFARLRTVFEATRDGGFWRLRWAITNEWPSSKLIWQQWERSAKTDLSTLPGGSATAECDELSALTSFLAGRLGVGHVGLFYPTWNHTIVAWEPEHGALEKKAPRLLLPTSQIFLGCDDAIDVTSFSATAQKQVYAYTPKDVAGTTALSPQLATFLLAQVDRYAGASRDVLALIRLHRALGLDSSVGECRARRAALAKTLAGALTCADEAALAHYWTEELNQPVAEPTAILRSLADPPAPEGDP